MEAKEPCIGCPDIQMDNYGYLCDLACGKRTAWLNYMAGIREAAEWIRQYECKNSEDMAYHWLLIPPDEWQAQLKNWRIK